MGVELNEEILAAFKERDPRFKKIELALAIERELNESVIIKVLLRRVEREKREAVGLLAHCNPGELKEVMNYQAIVCRAIFIEETIQSLFEEAKIAEDGIRGESEDHGDE